MSLASRLTGRFPGPRLLLAAAMAGLWPAVALAGPSPAPAQGIHYSIQSRPLGEALKDIATRSGIAFRLAEGLGQEKITASLDADTWQEATQSLLRGYNYAVEAGPGGAWQTVIVSGKNGDGKYAPPRSPSARHSLAKPEKLPVRFQGYRPGSVTPLNLPLATLKGMKKGQKISLDLPTGPRSLVHDNRHNHANGDLTWVGYLEQEGQPYRAMITLGRSGSMGHLTMPEGSYQIVSEGGQAYLIDIAASGLQPGSLLEDQATPDANPGGGNEGASGLGGGGPVGAVAAGMAAASSGWGDGAAPADARDSAAVVTIDLLVLYAKGLAQADTRVNYLTALANQAFLDSQIHAQIRVVHSQPVDYTATNDNAQALSDLTDAKAPFGNVPALREQYGADLVTLIRPFHAQPQKSCGIAWINGSNGSGLNPNWAYSVVSDGDDRDGAGVYCGGQTLAHELGHNLGNVHDRQYSAIPGAFPYSYAWGVAGRFGTIMSYLQPAVLLFASPLLADACQGQVCGYPEGDANASDNALTINQTAPIVAGFRPAVVPDKRP